MWRKIGFWALVVNLVFINGVLGFGIYKYLNTQYIITNNQTPLRPFDSAQGYAGQAVDTCGEECQRVIDEKLNLLKIELAAAAGPSAVPKTTLVPTKATSKTGIVVKPKVQTITYVTIPGNGSSQKMQWENLAGTEFYFNPADYPGLKDVYFEANMKLFNGNGMAYVQLFDATHGIGVQGSDVQTNSQNNSIVVSGRVSFWAGNNMIRVQAKTLTADTAVFNSGRLKIIQEN